MQDLTARYRISLAPTSQEGGNLIQPDLSQAAMTAPGSLPVTPLPAPTQGSNVPEPHEGPVIPLSSPKPQPRVGAGDRGGGWRDTPIPEDEPEPSPQWKQL